LNCRTRLLKVCQGVRLSPIVYPTSSRFVDKTLAKNVPLDIVCHLPVLGPSVRLISEQAIELMRMIRTRFPSTFHVSILSPLEMEIKYRELSEILPEREVIL
jgi:hypothetical protein